MSQPETEWTSHRDSSDERLAELMLYIAQRCEFDQWFGAVKLNKALFYADFLAYARFGRPITGTAYRRLQHGPVPRQLVQVRRALVQQGRAAVKTSRVHRFEQRRIVPLSEPRIDEFFTATEIALVDEVLNEIGAKNAKELSEMTHEFRGWDLAEHDEDIPYSTVFLAGGPPTLTDAEKRKGEELAQLIG